jgi:natural resistance-associated macrophage protein
MWAVGLLASGQSATMVCTYAGQIIMGGMLELKLEPWVRVSVTRVVALVPALAVALGTYGNAALFNTINEYLNILQSVQLPFAMLPVLHFSAQYNLMGRFTSGPCWFATTTLMAILVIVINVYLIILFVDDYPVWAIVLVCIYGVIYFYWCYRMVMSDLAKAWTYFTTKPPPGGVPVVQAEGVQEPKSDRFSNAVIRSSRRSSSMTESTNLLPGKQ